LVLNWDRAAGSRGGRLEGCNDPAELAAGQFRWKVGKGFWG